MVVSFCSQLKIGQVSELDSVKTGLSIYPAYKMYYNLYIFIRWIVVSSVDNWGLGSAGMHDIELV